MSMFVNGALVLTKQHSTTVEKTCQIVDFPKSFIWLAREHPLSQLFGAPSGSCWLLGALWAPMVALGGSLRKFIKTIVFFVFQNNIYLSYPRAIPNVSQELYSGSLRIHENHCFVDSWIQGQKIIKSIPGTGFVDFWSQGQKVIKSSLLGLVFSISGVNARTSSNRASWDSFCRLLEPRPKSN